MRVVHVPAEAGRDDPAGALRGGDRRADGAGGGHARLLPQRRAGSTSRASAASRTRRGAPVLVDAYQTIGSLPIDVRALDCDFLAAGVLKYLLGSAGLGVPLLPARARAGDRADRDRLVRRPRHLRDGHPRLLARADRAALRGGHAAGAVDLRGDRRDRADAGDRDRRDRGARARAERAAARRASRSSAARVVTPREPERSGALVCIPSTDVNALVAALAARGHRHLVARRQPARLGPLLQHGRGRPGRARRAGGEPPAARLEPGTVPAHGREGHGLCARV